MKFIRTVSTRRLLASIVGLLIAVAAGTAIAVAASGPGPVPAPSSLAGAVHKAVAAPAVTGISADISFTNKLIDSSAFTSQTADPILQGATGRLWLSNDHQLRLELQSSNGDSQVVVNKRSFWISDPMSHTVYEGTLPANAGRADKSDQSGSAAGAIPTLAGIQKQINELSRHANVSGAAPTDVAGRPAYTVSVSPKHDGGLLGQAQLAWDAVKGVPLRFAIYAKNDSSPVIELTATNISYGAVPASVFTIQPPAGSKVVKISSARTAKATSALHGAKSKAARAKLRHHRQISGLAAVASHVPFKPSAPSTLVGLPRRGVELLEMGGKPAALVTYGQNLGGIAVIEQAAEAGQGANASSGDQGSLSLPTVSINGATGEELDTALGTMVHFTRDGVAYTVIGSVPSAAADAAARGL
jgi:outer membrane lipoprotein-sorting protein